MEGRWPLHSCPAGPAPLGRGGGAGGAGEEEQEEQGRAGQHGGAGEEQETRTLEATGEAGAGLAYTPARAWRGDRDRHQSQEARGVHLAPPASATKETQDERARPLMVQSRVMGQIAHTCICLAYL